MHRRRWLPFPLPPTRGRVGEGGRLDAGKRGHLRFAFLLLAPLLALPLAARGQEAAAPPAASPSPTARAPETTAAPVHAVSLAGRPKYPAGFVHLDYVDPQAPKGGSLRQALVGSFDSLNPFIPRGDAFSPPGLFETLAATPDDDMFSSYGLLAASMEVAPDRGWMIFNLRPEARWHDGRPVTAEDVVFSFDVLREKGLPTFRLYYADVAKAEALSPLKVKFTFANPKNRELPSILGQLTVLPRHWWQGRAFDAPGLEPPLGSGPYRVRSVEPGRSVVMERVPDYWGRNHPLRVGTNNFDLMRYDFYRDPGVALQAFKAGEADWRVESSAKNWATAYDSPALADGRLKLALLPDEGPQPLQAFIFNLRRPVFQDRRVREAFGLAFDFEWSNRTLFYGQYTRARSYFPSSPWEAKGLPEAAELALLAPYRGRLPEAVFTAEYRPPVSDGGGENRDNLASAAALLEAAGWKLEKGRRVKDGQVLAFEFLIQAGDVMERIVQPYLKSLERLGVQGRIRAVDSAQYQRLIVEEKDFDMFAGNFGLVTTPGNEQRDFWSSRSAGTPGSANYTGLEDPAVDALIEALVNAPDDAALAAPAHALDRVLQWQHLVVPGWYLGKTRLAYWDKFGRPAQGPHPAYGAGLSAWWLDPAKEKLLQGGTAAEKAASAPPASGAASEPAADRGRSPVILLLYGLGFALVLWAAFALGRRGRKG